MRTPLYLLTATVIALLAVSSCNQVEETGLVAFGLEMTADGTQKSTGEDALNFIDNPNNFLTALVSIQGEDGVVVYDKEPLELLRFGSGIVTRSLKLPIGNFLLTEFMLVDSMGVVVWATPVEGSPLAHLVRDPLPRKFRVHPDETTNLDIQVVRVFDHPPSDFGYAEFHIGFVNRFCMKVMFACRCPQPWNDSTPAMGLPDDAGNISPGVPYLQPRLTIWRGERLILDEPLNPGLNKYVLPIFRDHYILRATGFFGEVFFEQRYDIEELQKFRCRDNYPPLVIHYGDGPGIIITPEDLLEPTIKQGVFGFLTEPGDPDPAGEIVIEPLVGELYFFNFNILDSIYTFAPIGCHIPFDWITAPPVAVVRSNSDGFFEVPLDAGEYNYMLLMENGYYIDAWLSSRRGGYVMVKPEELSELKIHVVDCSMWM